MAHITMNSRTHIEPTTVGALAGWRVTTPYGSALISQQGAQLLSYTPAGGRPLIWLSEQAVFKPGTPVRGGIPICWPWFGVYDRNPQSVRDSVAAAPGASSHGWVRQVDWQLSAQLIEDDTARLEFTFEAPRDHAPGWTHHAQLTLLMRFGKNIEITLSVRNRGVQDLTTTLALHTYLAVSDSQHVTIQGLEGHRYLDTVENWEPRQQQGAVRFNGETDRIYLDTATPLTLHDPGWKRDIRLQANGSRSTVVWNPGAAKAARLADMADDSWSHMACIETARVLDDALTVAPGATERVSLSIGWLTTG
ncbi:D-hexose-6-phosphate mutarotase [Bordetella tumbae]|uniref:D-hexose-6-phosphate mutarotase n=1 Tax=Bordetella tumbae TaxID=1649139 RepID=UPI0039EDF5EA